jgi:hypothetical protein
MRGRISTWDYRRRRAQFALCTRRSCGRDKEPCVSLESGAARSFAVERRLLLAILGMAMPPTWLISILLPVACATRVDCLYPWQFQYGGRDLSTWGIQLYGIYSSIQVVLLTNCVLGILRWMVRSNKSHRHWQPGWLTHPLLFARSHAPSGVGRCAFWKRWARSVRERRGDRDRCAAAVCAWQGLTQRGNGCCCVSRAGCVAIAAAGGAAAGDLAPVGWLVQRD